MSAHPLPGGGFLAAALASVEAFLLEPPPAASDEIEAPVRPVVAVCALARRCGATTLARGLAATLAQSDPAGAAIVARLGGEDGGVAGASVGLPGPARRLAGALAAQHVAVTVRGRLCLAHGLDVGCDTSALRGLAPLVLEVPPGGPAGAAAAAADHVVVVAEERMEPALAAVAEESLERCGPRPLVVLSRGWGSGGRWRERASVALPDSRAGARAAVAGHSPPGPLGTALADLWAHLDG